MCPCGDLKLSGAINPAEYKTKKIGGLRVRHTEQFCYKVKQDILRVAIMQM